MTSTTSNSPHEPRRAFAARAPLQPRAPRSPSAAASSTDDVIGRPQSPERPVPSPARPSTRYTTIAGYRDGLLEHVWTRDGVEVAAPLHADRRRAAAGGPGRATGSRPATTPSKCSRPTASGSHRARSPPSELPTNEETDHGIASRSASSRSYARFTSSSAPPCAAVVLGMIETFGSPRGRRLLAVGALLGCGAAAGAAPADPGRRRRARSACASTG